MGDCPAVVVYDLEKRTLAFARQVRVLVKGLRKSLANLEDSRQLIRASGSVGANYIEANEALSRKDFRLRFKICRKEAKESNYWLELLDLGPQNDLEPLCRRLRQEALELTKIFGAILRKTEPDSEGHES